MAPPSSPAIHNATPPKSQAKKRASSHHTPDENSRPIQETPLKSSVASISNFPQDSEEISMLKLKIEATTKERDSLRENFNQERQNALLADSKNRTLTESYNLECQNSKRLELGMKLLKECYELEQQKSQVFESQFRLLKDESDVEHRNAQQLVMQNESFKASYELGRLQLSRLELQLESLRDSYKREREKTQRLEAEKKLFKVVEESSKESSRDNLERIQDLESQLGLLKDSYRSECAKVQKLETDRELREREIKALLAEVAMLRSNRRAEHDRIQELETQVQTLQKGSISPKEDRDLAQGEDQKLEGQVKTDKDSYESENQVVQKSKSDTRSLEESGHREAGSTHVQRLEKEVQSLKEAADVHELSQTRIQQLESEIKTSQAQNTSRLESEVKFLRGNKSRRLKSEMESLNLERIWRKVETTGLRSEADRESVAGNPKDHNNKDTEMTPDARDGGRTTPRVDSPKTSALSTRSPTPPTLPSVHEMEVTLKNGCPAYLSYEYGLYGAPKDAEGARGSGILPPYESHRPLMLNAHEQYEFHFCVGRAIVSQTRIFTKEEEWDVSRYFY